MHGGIQQQVGHHLLHQDKIQARQRQALSIWTVTLCCASSFSISFQGHLDQVGQVTPVEFRLNVSGFQPGHAEEIADSRFSLRWLPGFHHHGPGHFGQAGISRRVQCAGRAADDGDGRSNFVRDGIEQGLAETFGFFD